VTVAYFFQLPNGTLSLDGVVSDDGEQCTADVHPNLLDRTHSVRFFPLQLMRI
jgi:hypothetical protein